MKTALLDSVVMREEGRNVSPEGGPKTFLRIRVRPGDVMAGQDASASVPANVTRLWERIEEPRPAGGQ
jgi:hypothetical protein